MRAAPNPPAARSPSVSPPPLAAGSTSIFIQFFAFFGFIFIVLQYLQIVRGNSPLLAAVSMLPMSAVLLPISRIAPGLTERFGPRPVCTAGLALIAGGLLVLAQLSQTSSCLPMLAGLIVLGSGMGLAMPPQRAESQTRSRTPSRVLALH